jgi:hypothetical protein
MAALAGGFSRPGGRGFRRSVSGALSEAPHSPENFAVVAVSAPHFGQPQGSTVPHSEQYFLPLGFSNPQLEQRIELSRNWTAASCLTQRRKKHFCSASRSAGQSDPVSDQTSDTFQAASETGYSFSWLSNNLASFRSAVSKPSVNQL